MSDPTDDDTKGIDTFGEPRVDHTLENVAMRDRSGNVRSRHPLVAVFYDLILKTGVPIADLEMYVREAETFADQDKLYTNGYIAGYAQDLTKRLAEGAAGDLAMLTILSQRYFDSLKDSMQSPHEIWKEVVRSILTGQYQHGRPR